MPYTLYLMPYTLYPVPYALYPVPYALYPVPYTLFPIPCTLYPIPYTLYPNAHTLNPTPHFFRRKPQCGKDVTDEPIRQPQVLQAVQSHHRRRLLDEGSTGGRSARHHADLGHSGSGALSVSRRDP